MGYPDLDHSDDTRITLEQVDGGDVRWFILTVIRVGKERQRG